MKHRWLLQIALLITTDIFAETQPPVLFVHGIFDRDHVFKRMIAAMQAKGFSELEAINLTPNDGGADFPEMARQVDAAAQRLLEKTQAARIDVVGFSMGALVTRYWIQRGNGKQHVRKFISISGPHQGTFTAYLNFSKAAPSMRFNSPMLESLKSDPTPWGPVEVCAFWTPYDLMIVPAKSSELPQAKQRTFPVWLHPWMLDDAKVHEAVIEELRVSMNAHPGPG